MEKRSILSGVDPMTTRRWFLLVNESGSCFSMVVHVSSEKSPTGAGFIAGSYELSFHYIIICNMYICFFATEQVKLSTRNIEDQIFASSLE